MFYKALLVLQFVASVQSLGNLNMKEFADSQANDMKTFDVPKAVKRETGFLNDQPKGEKSEHKIFYDFYKSQAGKQAPVIIWYMGGPGVETSAFSLYGFGAQSMHNGLHESKYGWHKFSNLVFTDWPFRTGFSHSKGPSKIAPQDFAKNATKFIKRWTERYSDFKGDIYIAGDSASGLWVPLIAQHALKDFKINDKELAGRFKGIVIEGPFMTVKYGFRDGVVLSDTLFHNVPKKNAKKFMKKIQETELMSKELFVLQVFPDVDKILNPLSRYQPYSANYYDLRHTTFENRKKKLMTGIPHHQSAGWLMYLIGMQRKYQMGHKIERWYGTGHGGIRQLFDPNVLIPGLIYAFESNVHEAYDYLYKNGMKIGTYFGEYDNSWTVQGLYDDFKTILPKDDYHELVHNGWTATKYDTRVKKMKNIHIGLLGNAGHMAAICRKKAAFEFVRNFVNDKEYINKE